MRAWPLAVAGVALVAAAAAALLASSVGSWDETVRGDDVRFAAGQRVDWSGDSILAAPARRLLALDDDLEARRALALYRRAAARGSGLGGGLERQGVRSAAEAALTEVAQTHEHARAAQAGVLLGTLLFADPAAGGTTGGPTPAERALGAFGNALEADPRADDAAYDLELVLRLLEARGERPGANPGAGAGGGGRRGAGGGTPGRGY